MNAKDIRAPPPTYRRSLGRRSAPYTYLTVPTSRLRRDGKRWRSRRSKVQGRERTSTNRVRPFLLSSSCFFLFFFLFLLLLLPICALLSLLLPPSLSLSIRATSRTCELSTSAARWAWESAFYVGTNMRKRLNRAFEIWPVTSGVSRGGASYRVTAIQATKSKYS